VGREDVRPCGIVRCGEVSRQGECDRQWHSSVVLEDKRLITLHILLSMGVRQRYCVRVLVLIDHAAFALVLAAMITLRLFGSYISCNSSRQTKEILRRISLLNLKLRFSYDRREYAVYSTVIVVILRPG